MAGSGRKRPSTGGEKDSSKQSKTKASSDSGISHYPLHEVLTEAQACLATELKDWGWQISSQGSSWLICKKQSQSEAFRKDLQAKDPLDFAGVSAFDKQEYAAAMKKYGCYECCVTYSWFDPLRFAHRAIPPALRFLPVFQLWFRGSVKLKAEKKYMSLGGVWHAGDSIMESIMVRATSATDPSTKDLEPLHQDAERVAFLYAWWKAKEQLLSEKSEANTLALKSFFVKARSYRATRQHRIHTVR
eukprot:s665_g16.t1